MGYNYDPEDDVYYDSVPHDFGYGKPNQVELDFLGVFKEEWNKDGSLKQRQLRAGWGRVGANIVSGGKRVKEVQQAMEGIIHQALLANYDAMVKGKAEPTGTLRRAVAEGKFESEDDLEGYAFGFKIADLLRTRNRMFSGYGGTRSSVSMNMTSRYGPVIFKGRQEISSANRMIFPGYAGGPRVVRTNEVRGVASADIFQLSPAQKSALIMSVMRPLKDIIHDQIQASSKE